MPISISYTQPGSFSGSTYSFPRLQIPSAARSDTAQISSPVIASSPSSYRVTLPSSPDTATQVRAVVSSPAVLRSDNWQAGAGVPAASGASPLTYNRPSPSPTDAAKTLAYQDGGQPVSRQSISQGTVVPGAGERSLSRSSSPDETALAGADRKAGTLDGLRPEAYDHQGRPSAEPAGPENAEDSADSEESGREPDAEQSAQARQSEDQADEKTSDRSIDPEQMLEISSLRKRDIEVRNHEQAHVSVGGIHASPASFDYEKGPDGRRYAVEGEVSIDAAPVANDPEATIRKLETVRRAALAPAEPSPQDLRVAAEAARGIVSARAELLARQRGELNERERPEGIGAIADLPPLAPGDADRQVDRPRSVADLPQYAARAYAIFANSQLSENPEEERQRSRIDLFQ